jgi:hypothetical protein
MIHERNRASSPLQASLGEGDDCYGTLTVDHCGWVFVLVKRTHGKAHQATVRARASAPTRPGEILVSAPLGRLVEGWCKLKPREVLVGDGALDQIGVDRVVGVAPR